MSLKKVSARAFCLILVVGLALLSEGRANAQDRIQAKVVGFAVRNEGVTPQPKESALAKLGDRVTVRIDPLPTLSDQQSTKSSAPATSTNSFREEF